MVRTKVVVYEGTHYVVCTKDDIVHNTDMKSQTVVIGISVKRFVVLLCTSVFSP